MPSRFTGSFPHPWRTSAAPGDDIVDGEAAGDEHSTRPESGVPAAVGGPTEATRIGWTTPAAMTLTPSDRPMPGGPVPIGGWEERLSWEDLAVILDNEPFDLRLVLIPRVNETRRDRGVSVMSALKTKSDPFKGI